MSTMPTFSTTVTASDGNYLPSLGERLTPSIDRYQRLFDKIMQSARVALPGIVQTFDPGPPATVSVLIATNEFVQQDMGGDNISLQTTALQLPLLTDVPISIPNGGGWSLTFPFQQGDEVWVTFSDTMLDVWLQNGGLNNTPLSTRRHSLSDGVAISGLRSTPRGIANYSITSTQLRSDDGSVVIDLATNGITITAPKVTVNTTGDLDLTIGGNVSMSATGTIAIASGSGHDTTIDGTAFTPHYHDGVMNGGGDTGPVVGP